MRSDIEIANQAKILPIEEIAKKLNLKEQDLYNYGPYIAKITADIKDRANSKLILVTATNPTPAGEGKTTVNIGLSMALNAIGESAISVLREPSLGPVFGIKGGATGGGMSQILPMSDINLHFTGDIHAITTANNLISAAIDNHIYHGNQLGFKRVVFRRCLDMNDRVLRDVTLNVKFNRSEKFDITAASEMMAIFCLSKNLTDFKRRVEQILLGYNEQNQPIYTKQLQVAGAVVAIIKQALLPNLVQTSENTPALIHGGPFANIAHGCNSIVATTTGQSLADYTIVEAGFGADLGAEKFLDIKANVFDLQPNAVVLVTTIRSLKYQGGAKLDNLTKPDLNKLKHGLVHLKQHIDNLIKFKLPVIVSINKFVSDSSDEIELLSQFLSENNVNYSVTEIWKKGSQGGLDLAQKVKQICQIESQFEPLYKLNDSIEHKISTIATQIYRADGVDYSNQAKQQLADLPAIAKAKPICIAKTQTSFSDNPNLINAPRDFRLQVKSLEYKYGSEFVVVKTGKIMTMPGLPKHSAYEKIDVIDNKITGLF